MSACGHLKRGAIVRFASGGRYLDGLVLSAPCAGVLVEVDGERVRVARTAVVKVLERPRRKGRIRWPR